MSLVMNESRHSRERATRRQYRLMF
ncbi:MAG: hypothetical protein RIQ68_1760, partial [Pseudomonadota bacterium]